jgi:GNAT superfamily N-acetyltransferase
VKVRVRQASIADLDGLVPLFDASRQFYGHPSDCVGTRAFLADRFDHRQSVIMLAEDEGQAAVGFAQLFPSFSSTRLARTLVLNNLFVSADSRGQGVGRALLAATHDYGRHIGAVQLLLSTAVDNVAAQSLYEQAGWTRDISRYAYGIDLA